MDRSLDDIIHEQPRDRASREPRRPPPTAPRGPRREEYPRDGVRKTRRDDRADLDSDWVHDRYEDDRDRDRSFRQRPADERPARRDEISGAKLRVDNVHYELTEKDLRELFERIGPVRSVKLLYDRMDRSEGTAFVSYDDVRDAKDAIAEFNGCNANGQPIKLTLIPTAPAPSAGGGNLFNRIERPGRSLFDRIDASASRDDSRDAVPVRRRNRSESPRRRPTPDNIDRYVPGRRSRSPIKRRGTPRDRGRRPGQRGEATRGGRRPRADDDGRPLVGGRPRKTAEELDAEMADYWGGKDSEPAQANGTQSAQNGAATAPAPAQPLDDDIDMAL